MKIGICIFVAILFVGCSVVHKDKFVDKYIPVPTTCDLNMTRAPEIKSNSMQEIIESLTKLTLDSIKLREAIENLPCVKVNYID